MKILQVGSALFDWGGIERYLVYLNQGLIEREHQVWLAAPPGSPLYQKAGGEKVPIALRGQFQLSRLASYLRLYRRAKFDVVNVHFSRDFIVPAIAARIASQKNLILTRHVVLHWSRAKVRRYNRLYDGFIGVSEAVGAKLIASGVPASKVQVALSGSPALVPTSDRENCRNQFGVSEFAVGFFGRVVDDKGVRLLCEIAPKLAGSQVHIFGDGPLLKSLKAQANGVHFHGKIADVANAMSAMDAVAIPSQWEEALCYTALEAMSLGIPVVATRTGGLPEVVLEGGTGILVEKHDRDGLIKAFESLRDDLAFRAELGKNARLRHQEVFTVEKMAERVESCYQNVIEQRR